MVWQAARELFYRFSAGLSLTVSRHWPSLLWCCTEGWHIWPGSGCRWLVGALCPVRVSLLITRGQAVPGSSAHGLCGLYSQLAEFLSVSWNICWITDTGEFHVLSHRKFSGLQSWLQIAPGNNSEYIFASNISMGKDEFLHMIWGFFFCRGLCYQTKLIFIQRCFTIKRLEFRQDSHMQKICENKSI